MCLNGGIKLKFEDIKDELIEVIKSAKGDFLTAYQICQKLESIDPMLWQSIVETYPSATPETLMGEGTGHKYSPASFVGNALKHFTSNGSIVGLQQELLECEGVTFNGVEPGFTGNRVGIWSIKA